MRIFIGEWSVAAGLAARDEWVAHPAGPEKWAAFRAGWAGLEKVV
jgi:hypothetical protein